jgi:hypothetical protein
MQGGYEQTAEISRRIIEMAQSDKLADILHIRDDGVVAVSRNYVKEATAALCLAYETKYSRSAVTSAIQTTLPAFLGVPFVPYTPPEKASSGRSSLGERITDLEDRVAFLEEERKAMRHLLDSVCASHEALHQRVQRLEQSGEGPLTAS